MRPGDETKVDPLVRKLMAVINAEQPHEDVAFAALSMVAFNMSVQLGIPVERYVEATRALYRDLLREGGQPGSAS